MLSDLSFFLFHVCEMASPSGCNLRFVDFFFSLTLIMFPLMCFFFMSFGQLFYWGFFFPPDSQTFFMYSGYQSSISCPCQEYLLVCGLSSLSPCGIFWGTKDLDFNGGKYSSHFLYGFHSCVLRNYSLHWGHIDILIFPHILRSGCHILVGRCP